MKNLILSIFKTFLFFDLSLILINLLPMFSGKSESVTALINSSVGLAVVLVLTIVFVLFVEKRQVTLPFKKPILGFLKGLFIGAFLPIVAVAFSAFLNKFKFTPETDFKKIGLWWLVLLINCIMVELLLRGYLFSLFKRHFGLTFTIIATTILSCSLDFTVFSQSKIYIANILLLNVLLCLVLFITNSLTVSITARYLFFAVNTVLLGSKFPIDGYPAVYKINFSGNIFFNGGKYGIMGSVLMLVILSVFCLILIYKAYNMTDNFKRLSKFLKRFSK